MAGNHDQNVKWIPVLVRTGCFRGDNENDPNDPADVKNIINNRFNS